MSTGSTSYPKPHVAVLQRKLLINVQLGLEEGGLVRRMDGWVDGWVGGWMGGWMNGWVDGWVDGWMDGWMDGRMDGWMSEDSV